MRLIKRTTENTIDQLYASRAIALSEMEYRFDLKGAVEMIRESIKEGEQITVVGDYDCDGVCATAIMLTTLTKLGAKVGFRIPLRFLEGYGLNPSIIDEIEAGLLLTVDNGITAIEAVRKAKQKGLKVIVTDHHLPDTEGGMQLPDADIIIDPHIEGILGFSDIYDYYHYCGAGLALKLCEALLPENDSLLADLYAYAAIATVADVMPVTRDNRKIIRRGTEYICSGKTRPGILRLIEATGVNPAEMPDGIEAYNFLSTEHIGYKLAPCINAPSRIVKNGGTGAYGFVKAGGDGAKISLAALLSEGRLSEKMASVLLQYNEKRKEMTEEACALAKKTISLNGMENDFPLVVYPDAKLHPGIVGIVAGKLSEEYGVPSIVLTDSEQDEEICTGSCRSPGNACGGTVRRRRYTFRLCSFQRNRNRVEADAYCVTGSSTTKCGYPNREYQAGRAAGPVRRERRKEKCKRQPIKQ